MKISLIALLISAGLSASYSASAKEICSANLITNGTADYGTANWSEPSEAGAEFYTMNTQDTGNFFRMEGTIDASGRIGADVTYTLALTANAKTQYQFLRVKAKVRSQIAQCGIVADPWAEPGTPEEVMCKGLAGALVNANNNDTGYSTDASVYMEYPGSSSSDTWYSLSRDVPLAKSTKGYSVSVKLSSQANNDPTAPLISADFDNIEIYACYNK